MEEEIDLRQYIEVILRRWPWIVGLSLLAAFLAFTISTFLKPVYEAEAKVIILKSKTDISFEPSIRDENKEGNGIQTQRDYQQTLVNLVKSSDIATIVLGDAENLLPPANRNLLDLLDKVDTSNDANIITIKVTNSNPTTAAQLADIWAQAYETYINRLFNGRSIVLLKEVEAQAIEVAEGYQVAQTNLEDFLSNNQITTLERDIANLNQNLDTKYNLLIRQYNVKHDILANKYNELKRIDNWLDDARTVQDQLKNTSPSSGANLGNLLALMLLQERSSLGNSPPMDLQINLSEINGHSLIPDDAAKMIAVIEAHKTRIEADIEELSVDLLQEGVDLEQSISGSELAQSIEPLIARKLVLEGTLAAQKAQERELRAIRDLAWENHQAVQRKLAEIRLDTQITDSEVRIAAHAITPRDPVSPRRLLNTVIGGALGFMLAIVSVFVIEYWQNGLQFAEKIEPVPEGGLTSTP